MTSIRAPWVAYLAVTLPLAAVTLLLPVGPGQRILFVAVAVSSAVAILAGARLNRSASPMTWYAVAATQVLWVAGDVAQQWALDSHRDGDGSSQTVAGGLYLLAYLGIALAAGHAAHSRSGVNTRTDVLQAATVTAPLLLIAWVLMVEPRADGWRDAGIAVKPIELVFPLAAVLMLGAFILLARAPGAGHRVAAVPAWTVAAMLALDATWFADTPLLTSWPVPFDARWLVMYPLAGAAVLHPVSTLVTAPGSHGRPRPHGAEIVGLVVAMLAGPALLTSQVVRGEAPSVLVTAAFGAVITLLAGARMVTLLRLINLQATTDDLTGLANRRGLATATTPHLADPARPHALLLLDLDRFKEINDSLGHHSGDELLVQVAERLRTIVGPDDVLARLGGDEFAILLHDRSAADALEVAQLLQTALRAPCPIGDLTVHTSASIGVALFPAHGSDLAELLRRADVAMYRAKREGGVVLHAHDDDQSDRLALVEELHDGLGRGELVVHFQPKVDLASGEVAGVEALARWNHPVRGLLMPGAFLDRAEEAGLMPDLTDEVLRLSLDQAAAWWATGLELQVAVNLSASSLVDSELPVRVIAELARRDLPAAALQLEITEEFLMADRVRAQSVLGALRSAGVSIAVDDFGTGYSSLAYLRDLPIDELKLDRSFVRPMTEDPRAAALVASTVSLAHSLGLRMVAEGVEDLAAFQNLAAMGCDQAQGYHLSPALPAEALARWLSAWFADRDVVPRPRATADVA